MHQEPIRTAGRPLTSAAKALILLHGRGGSAADILSLAQHLHVADFALLAPQATQHTWYPYSFLAPPPQNEPWLTDALVAVGRAVAEAERHGIAKEHIYLLGFSQGACLTLEYAARHAARYGGVAAFTGGLIGDQLYPAHYGGDFAGTPIYLGSSDPDPHVPAERVRDSARVLRGLGAEVTEQIFPNMGHTITTHEINEVNRLLFGAAS